MSDSYWQAGRDRELKISSWNGPIRIMKSSSLLLAGLPKTKPKLTWMSKSIIQIVYEKLHRCLFVTYLFSWLNPCPVGLLISLWDQRNLSQPLRPRVVLLAAVGTKYSQELYFGSVLSLEVLRSHWESSPAPTTLGASPWLACVMETEVLNCHWAETGMCLSAFVLMYLHIQLYSAKKLCGILSLWGFCLFVFFWYAKK